MFKWNVIAIGHLSRNRYWGESEEEGYRMPMATCSLIQTGTDNILVDPSLPEDEMAKALFDNSGLKPEQITKVYSTHFHYDHHVSPLQFSKAEWFMSAIDQQQNLLGWEEFASSYWESIKHVITQQYDEFMAKMRMEAEKFIPAADEIVPGLRLVPLPGHTEGTAGLLFDGPEGRVLMTGDAVMTKDFFRERRPFFFGWNYEEAENSMHYAAGIADIIVPGHGEAFVVSAFSS